MSAVLFLMGPTAAGKTAAAIELTEHYPFEIISVDSALVYRGMDIGTAKPDAGLLARAPHRLLDIRDPSEPYSAAEFREDALREMGCKLALGDFGTGYSSFSYLQKLQFDYIKIDGSFVEDMLNKRVDQKMIKLIAEVGREAHMQTVAEYVQDAESLELLGELGVDLAQ